MKPSVRNALLVFVDATLGFLVFCVLPISWILKDGLGPDMVESTGLEALWRTSMTFHVGPAILLFVSFDLLLRRAGNPEKSNSSRASILSWVAMIALVAALSLILAHGIFSP